MFAVDCPGHLTRVLLGPANVTGLFAVPGGGVGVRWRCTCGSVGVSAPRRGPASEAGAAPVASLQPAVSSPSDRSTRRG